MADACIFALQIKRAIALEILQKDLVAQLVEQYTFNVWALGSSPSQITKNLKAFKIVDFKGFFSSLELNISVVVLMIC